MANPPTKPMTLTQVASTMRMFILVGGIMILLVMVGRFFLTSFVNYWKATHPAPPPPPSVGFQILPRPKFPSNVGTPRSYKLEITPAKLKAPSDRAAVFFIKAKRANLLALDQAKEQARALTFLFEPDRITEEMYRWQRTLPLPSVLDYNIITGTFTMTLDWRSDQTFIQNKQLPKEDQAIVMTKSLLSSAGLLGKDIATGSAKVTYIKASGDTLATAVSFSEADFLQVDLFRIPVRDYEVITEEPGKGTIRAIVTGNSDSALRFSSIEYNYVPIEYGIYETYPIITPTQAFQSVSQGLGYTAAMPENGSDVIVRNIRLAYYDSKTTQQYLEPVYVLEGDGGFVGYISAISPDYLQQ